MISPQHSNQIITPTPITEKNIKLGDSVVFKRNNHFIENTDFHGGSQKRTTLQLIIWSWMATTIDSLILTSFSCFTIITFSFSVRFRIFEALKFILFDKNITELFLIIFIFGFWTYLIFMRAFAGATFGEWTCQIRLGQPVERINSNYIFKVIARTSIIIGTGIIPLPILSILFKRDLVGDLTGLKVYSLV